MKITQRIAERVASEMVVKKNQEFNQKIKDLEIEIAQEIEKTIPTSVLLLNKKEPSYFHSSNLYIKDNNNCGHYIYCPFPTDRTKSNVVNYIENQSLIDQWKTEYVAIGNFKKDIDLKREELQEIILSFRTLKVLAENLPEAAELVDKLFPPQPKATSQLPATQMKELLNWLQ